MKTTAVGERGGVGFREVLQRELAQRCADNPQYSLRAFARSLRIDHSTLSQILRGRRRLTGDTIRALADRLGIEDADAYVARERRVGDADGWERHARQLQEEAMEVLSQSHHFAILELTKLDSFRPDCRWIARVLDIPVDEVNRAITRLLHLGLLRMADRKTWVDCSKHATARFERLPWAVAHELMQRVARLVATREPVLSSSTIAIDRKRIPVVTDYLARVRREIAELCGGSDDVYQLDILLYPLTTLGDQEWANP